MADDKRLLRELKRQLKKAGNRKRRRHLKDLDADPGDFDFGRDGSRGMNNSDSHRHADHRSGSGWTAS